MANSVVPKFTFTSRIFVWSGNYAWWWKAYDPRLIYAWPTASMAVMSGCSAAKDLLQDQSSLLKNERESPSRLSEKELPDEITAKYNEELSPYYAASSLGRWSNRCLEKLERIKYGNRSANHAPITNGFNVGVIRLGILCNYYSTNREILTICLWVNWLPRH